MVPHEHCSEVIPSAACEERPAYDWEGALRALDGDRMLLETLGRIFSETAPEILKSLAMGLQNSDRRTLFRGAHRLKGALGSLCATDIMNMAGQLEQEAFSATVDRLHAHVQNLQEKVTELIDVFLKNGVQGRQEKGG